MRRTADSDELLAAITATLGGGAFLTPQLVGSVLSQIFVRPTTDAGSAAILMLTPREQEVLELLAVGLSNQEIADRLLVGEPTVKYHVSHVLRKLGLRDRLQAVAFAYKNGLAGR